MALSVTKIGEWAFYLSDGATATLRVKVASPGVTSGRCTLAIESGPAWVLPRTQEGAFNVFGDANFVLSGTPVIGDGMIAVRASAGALVARAAFPLTVAASRPVGGVTAESGAVRLTWFQAEAEAAAGVRVRRVGWANRYLEYATGLWTLQFFSATTKTLGLRRTVTATDFLQEDFRALDWTYEGIAGQIAGAGTASAGVPADRRFP